MRDSGGYGYVCHFGVRFARVWMVGILLWAVSSSPSILFFGARYARADGGHPNVLLYTVIIIVLLVIVLTVYTACFVE